MSATIVRGVVKSARYYEEEKSLLLIIADVENGKASKPMQISVNALKEQLNLSVDANDAEAWRFFAKELMKRKAPLCLQFDGETQEDQVI